MDLALKLITLVISAISVGAAVYNVLTARTHQKDQQQKAKLEATWDLAKKNEQNIDNLEKRMGECEQRTEKRLDQIAHDIGAVKNMFTDFIIDNLRHARK
ncbi:hypothetical protein GCM10027346_20750 [Hymenobacter seoulensis]